jgi:hypothetical protein
VTSLARPIPPPSTAIDRAALGNMRPIVIREKAGQPSGYQGRFHAPVNLSIPTRYGLHRATSSNRNSRRFTPPNSWDVEMNVKPLWRSSAPTWRC